MLRLFIEGPPLLVLYKQKSDITHDKCYSEKRQKYFTGPA